MKFTLTFSLLVQVFVVSSVTAEKPPSETIAPYLHENTLIVARFQLEKFDLGRGTNILSSTTSLLNPLLPSEFMKGLIPIVRNLKQLKHEGVNELYAVFSPTFFYDLNPYIYVPTPNGVDKTKVSRLMFSGKIDGTPSTTKAKRTNFRGTRSFQLCETLGDGVFCGRAIILKDLKLGRVTKRPNLHSAFDSVKDRAIQILFVPSNDQRRVISEIMPPLPKNYGSLTGKQLADGIEWAVVGIDFGEKFRLDLVVQSKSNADAHSMKKLLTTGLGMITEKHPNQGGIKLAPRVVENRLIFSFTQKVGEPGPFTKVISGRIARAQQAAKKTQCRNNLKRLGISLHNFHERYNGLPPRSNFDLNGRKLLSWRVFLLPYMGHTELYNEFHLDEPWDSAHNKKLISKMPDIFACPSADLKKQGKTTYLAIAHEKAALAEKTNRRFREFLDGISYTIIILEVPKEKAIVWTKPEDLKIDWKNPTKSLGSEHGKKFHALMGNSSVRLLSITIDKETFRALITFAGKEIIDRDKIK